MTPDQIQKLEGLAKEATAGNWRPHVTRSRPAEVYTDVTPSHSPNPLIARGVIRKRDAAYIAAANPQAVLELIAFIRSQEERIGELVPLTTQMARAQSDMWQEANARALAAEASLSEALEVMRPYLDWAKLMVATESGKDDRVIIGKVENSGEPSERRASLKWVDLRRASAFLAKMETKG